MIKLNPMELPNKIRIDEAVMRERANELMPSRDDSSIEEQRAIADALNNLALLERVELRPAFGVQTNQQRSRKGRTMRRMCRHFTKSGSNRQLASTVLRHLRIVTDPKKLAWLYAEADRQKRCAEIDRKGTRKPPAS